MNIKNMTKVTVILATFGLSSMAYSSVTLNVDKNIKVTAINGKLTNNQLLSNDKMQFTLQPGQHVITARYDRLYDLSRKEHDYLRSSDITLTAKLEDNQTYQLAMPNQPEKYQEAKKYASNPTLAIILGSKTIASQSIESNDSFILSNVGNKIGGIFGKNKSIQENTKAIAAINKEPIQTQPDIQIHKNTSILDEFMKIWLKATPDERQRIRDWVEK